MMFLAVSQNIGDPTPYLAAEDAITGSPRFELTEVIETSARVITARAFRCSPAA